MAKHWHGIDTRMRHGLLILLLSLAPAASVMTANTANTLENLPGFAVAELFTSEGCSSCPPADRLLAKWVADSQAANLRLYALAFHVDYWDDLGWKDPYSNPGFTRRQEAYSSVFGPGRVYTPQLIINGAEQLVGSQSRSVRRAISRALATHRPGEVRLRLGNITTGGVQIAYQTEGLPKHAWVHIAVVERGLVQRVTRGENAGRLLRHENVVRAFQTRRTAEGDLFLPFPENLNAANSTLVAYVQDPKTLAVLAATKAAMQVEDTPTLPAGR